MTAVQRQQSAAAGGGVEGWTEGRRSGGRWTGEALTEGCMTCMKLYLTAGVDLLCCTSTKSVVQSSY